jgi:cysteine desulfurase
VRTLYFDYNSTTPLDPLVRAAMRPFLEAEFGNPSSVHHVGRRARAALDEARERTARVLACKPGEVMFTSGGTESNNAAILGAARLRRETGRHLITSAVEHHAVLNCFEHLHRREGFQLTLLPVDQAGRVDPSDLERAFRPDTALVSIMAANNETGTLQPVAELGRLCRQRGILFHTDAVQWFGKLPLKRVEEFNADLVSLCGHKLHGPKGVGALFIRSPLRLEPLLFGGPQEGEHRAGTENVAACVGLADALGRFISPPVFPPRQMENLTASLASLLRAVPGLEFRGALDQRLPNTLALTVTGCDSSSMLAALDLEGICASSGSACSAGSVTPSHVLRAMGVSPTLASSFLRFSLGRDSEADQVALVAEALLRIVERIRRAGKSASPL